MMLFSDRRALRALLTLLAVAPLTWTLAAPTAHAIPYGFSCISFNSATDCAIGEAQLSVDVIDLGGGQVLFDFTNAGPASSSITDVYFDDGTLLGIAGLIDMEDDALGSFGHPDVDFSQDASPPNLPGGSSISFQVTAGFLADSDPPVSANGVNPGEMLGIVFDLQPGRPFSDVLDDLASGALRIGIHVQDFAGGGSEGFVNLRVSEPGTALLLGLGLAGLSRRAA